MRIYKNCKRLDFSTGSLKTYYIINPDHTVDIEYFIQRLWEALRVPPHLMGQD
jgi:hypothetical protein